MKNLPEKKKNANFPEPVKIVRKKKQYKSTLSRANENRPKFVDPRTFPNRHAACILGFQMLSVALSQEK